MVQRLGIFFDAIQDRIPSNIACIVPGTGAQYDDVTGVIQGAWQSPSGHTSIGTGVEYFASPVGALLRLGTQTVVGRRVLKGRVFLVPLATNAYAHGGIGDSTLSMINAAGADLTTDVGDFLLKVWHRPKAGAGGSSAFVTSITAAPQVAVLTSRRD